MFPTNSAFDDRDRRELQREYVEKLRPKKAEAKTVAIPVSKLNEWIDRLEEIAWDTPDALAADGLADDLRSHLPG